MGTVNSERGNVSIDNRSGSLLSGSNEYKEVGDHVYLEENVHGRDIALAARDSVGSADKVFLVEETAHENTQILNTYMVSLYGEPGMTDTGILMVADSNNGRTDNKPIGKPDTNNGEEMTWRRRWPNPLTSALPTMSVGAAEKANWPHHRHRKDTVRAYEESEATSLNLSAQTGSIFVTERTAASARARYARRATWCSPHQRRCDQLATPTASLRDVGAR